MTDAHTTHTVTTVTFKDRALRAIAVLGLIALLLLGAWGIIQIAFTLYGLLGSAAPSPSPAGETPKTEQIVVSLPQTTQSGTPFTLSFTHENGQGNFAYQFSYACVSGLSVQAPAPNGSMQTVPCNTPFNYTNATSQTQLVASITGTAPISTIFTVAAKNLATNTITASANANIAILPSATTTPPKPTSGTSTARPSSTYVPSTRTTTLSGSPDLAVTMGQVSNLGGGRYSVQFTIANVGTNVAASGWTFNAILPTSPTYTYTSNAQQALNPGDKIVYTLGFTMAQSGYGYPSYGYGATYNPYSSSNCGYTTTYTYNGVYNYPSTSYTCTNNTNYTQQGYTYNSHGSYGYQPYPGSSVVTVNVDPNYRLAERTRGNNTGSATVY